MREPCEEKKNINLRSLIKFKNEWENNKKWRSEWEISPEHRNMKKCMAKIFLGYFIERINSFDVYS